MPRFSFPDDCNSLRFSSRRRKTAQPVQSAVPASRHQKGQTGPIYVISVTEVLVTFEPVSCVERWCRSADLFPEGSRFSCAPDYRLSAWRVRGQSVPTDRTRPLLTNWNCLQRNYITNWFRWLAKFRGCTSRPRRL